MKYCDPALDSRQMLRKLGYTINELRNALLEDARLDIPLLSNHHFYAAMEALLTADQEVAHLRGAASPISLLDLERDRKEECV